MTVFVFVSDFAIRVDVRHTGVMSVHDVVETPIVDAINNTAVTCVLLVSPEWCDFTRDTATEVEFASALTDEEQLREVPDAEVQFGTISREAFAAGEKLKWFSLSTMRARMYGAAEPIKETNSSHDF